MISKDIGDLALNAILFEVAATPKPGLVDRHNSGAHSDMDFFTFMSSAAALRDTFDTFTVIGIETKSIQPCEVLTRLQKFGMEAEQSMFAATSGINTHKGMIFSLGLICAAIGRLYKSNPITLDNISLTAAEFTKGLCDRAFSNLKYKTVHTKGERMYLEHGLTGVRGEAEGGYPTVRNVSYPMMKKLLAEGHAVNDVFVQTLIYLIASTADTNIISRHDLSTAEYAKKRAEESLMKGGIFTEAGRQDVLDMDKDFIRRNISPGGSADLLAVTYLVIQAEEKLKS